MSCLAVLRRQMRSVTHPRWESCTPRAVAPSAGAAAQLKAHQMRDMQLVQLKADRDEGQKMEAMTISERLEYLKSAAQTN